MHGYHLSCWNLSGIGKNKEICLPLFRILQVRGNNSWLVLQTRVLSPDGEDITGIIKAMMFEQRAIQDVMPSAERVYIGGQINVIILEKDCVRLMTIADFPDFSSVINKLF